MLESAGRAHPNTGFVPSTGWRGETFLMRSDKTAMEAAQQVKTWVPALNRTSEQLKTFRANLINDRYSPEVGKLYQRVLDEAADWPPEQAAKLAAELLREKLTK